MSAVAAGRAMPVIALAFAGLACSEPAGLRVDVSFGDFAKAASLEVAITASGGFKMQAPFKAGDATVTTEDFDGDGTLDLVAHFLGPFVDPIAFRVDTGNATSLDIQAHARAFDATKLVAGADGTTTLPPGGHQSVALALTARNPDAVGPSTRTTDLGTAAADVTAEGAHENGHLSALAVCDLDNDGADDLVIGAPDADDARLLGGVGAVYVVFGGATSETTIDLSNAQNGQELHFFGRNSGDHLGSAVACADLNHDGYADLVVGAPGGTDGSGNIYAMFGASNLRHNKTIDLASTDHLPDVHWQTNVFGAHLGSALYAKDLDGDQRAEILVSAPDEQKVHLFTNVVATAAPIDVELPDHVTFSGLRASALGAGDLNGDTANTHAPLDVIIGDVSYRKTDEIDLRGAVYIFSAVNPAGTTQYALGATGTLGPAVTMVGDPQSQYGSAVLALDSGRGDDLLVGVPGDNNGTGSVFLYANDASFFLAAMRNAATHDDALPGLIAGGRFGSTLATSASGGAGSGGTRLAVGAPSSTLGNGRTQAGAAYLFLGTTAQTFSLLDQLFGHANGDHLGTAVAGGKINAGDLIGDLAATAPFATGAKPGSGVAYVRFGR